MKKILKIAGIILLGTILPITSVAQWQADMVNRMASDTEKNYSVYSNLKQYRYDFVDNGMQGSVIVDPEKNVAAIMLHNEKKVHYTPANGLTSRMNDPVQAYLGFKEEGEEKMEGVENIMGFECVKKVIYGQDGKPVFSAWFSEELNFPLKLQAHWDEFTYMYLENIRSWEADPSFFEVPAGFTEVDKDHDPDN